MRHSSGDECPVSSSQVVLLDDGDHLLHLRQQLAIFRHRHERPVLFGIAHLILGVEGRHPHHAPPSALHHRHALHGRRIDAAHRQIQVDPAEYLDPRDLLAHHIRQRRGRFVMVLQHQPPHPASLGQLRQIDRVDRPRRAVRIAMRVDIDHAVQRLPPKRRGTERETRWILRVNRLCGILIVLPIHPESPR